MGTNFLAAETADTDALSTEASVRSLDHINIVTSRFGETISFFVDAIGLRRGPTPSFGDENTAAWLFAGATAVIHLVRHDGVTSRMPEEAALNHIAFACDNMAAMESRLERAGVTFERRVYPEFRIRQLVVRDPNNIMVELGF